MMRLSQSRHRPWRVLLLLLVCCSLFETGSTALAVPQEKADSPPEKAKTDQAESQNSPESEVVAAQKITAIVGATVHTMGPKGVLQNATVLVYGQEIQSVGVDVKIPDNADRIDASGMILAPGLIDSRSSLWLASDSLSASASDGSLNAVDAVNPFSDLWQEVARHGVTSVRVGPKGALGGQSVLLRVAPASSTAELLIRNGISMQASLGLSGSTGNSRDRYAQYEALKKRFDSAKAYKESWKKYEEAEKKFKKDAEAAKKKTASGKETAKPTSGDKKSAESSNDKAAAEVKQDEKKGDEKKQDEKKPEPPKKPTKDPAKEALVRVLDGDLPLHIEAHRADDVAHALKLAADFELTVVLEGASDAGRTWDVLKEEHPALIAGPMVAFESTPSYASSKPQRYSALKEFEGLLAISTFARDPRASRLLRFHAAEAVAEGIKPGVALAAITSNAAKVLGLDDQLGSIQAGKLADLIVVAGDPLNPAAPVMMTMSHGKIVYQDSEVAKLPVSNPVDEVQLPDSLPSDYAIVSDRVLLPSGKLSPAAVIVRGNQIAAVRKDKKKTGDLQVFDAGSAVVTPGLLVGHYADPAIRTSDAVAARVRATDALPPESKNLKKLAQAGFTSVIYAPDSQSVIAGRVGCVRIQSKQAVVYLPGGTQDLASKFVLSARSRSTNRFPSSLTGQMQLVREYFQGAPPRQNLYLPQAAMKYLKQEQDQLREALMSGQTVALLEASSAPEIEAAARIAEQFQLKPLILNPEDISSTKDLLKELDAGLVVKATSVSDYHWYCQDIASASGLGIPIAVSGSDGNRIRQTLASLVNAGMQPDAALRAVTSDAATSYGLRKLGRLAKGSVADIVIWSDTPLNVAARPLSVIVDGRVMESQR